MGFARSGIRQHWHVYGVMRDNSVDAVTPAIGYAANMITTVTIVFFALVMFMFWLGGLGEKGKAGESGHAATPVFSGGSDADPARTASGETRGGRSRAGGSEASSAGESRGGRSPLLP
jgi:cytochrome d ubiquinol oxidase subunit I